MDNSTQFIDQYLTAQELNDYQHPPAVTGIEAIGRALIFDYPIKGFIKYACRVFANLIGRGYKQHLMVVGNEAGAILAALLAVGYSPGEIIELLASGQLDVVDLVEGKTKIRGKSHKQVHGADHKGHRLAERIEELAQAKLGFPGDREVLLVDLIKMPLHITALDETTNAVVTLNKSTYPHMRLAEAVLASCAVQPYIYRVEYTGSEKVTHKFFSCSTVHSLPLDTAVEEYTKLKLTAPLQKFLVAYGCKDMMADVTKKRSKDSKGAYQETIQNMRAKAIVGGTYSPNVRLY